MSLLINLSKPEHRRWRDALNAESTARAAACEHLRQSGPDVGFHRLVEELKARAVTLNDLPAPWEPADRLA